MVDEAKLVEWFNNYGYDLYGYALTDFTEAMGWIDPEDED